MTREFVRAIPVLSPGFQIEAEMSIQALHKDMRVWEVPVKLSNRIKGSNSKIRILSDGCRIAFTIFDLFRTYKPLTVFGLAGMISILIGSAIGLPVFVDYFQTGLAQRLPRAILSAGLWLTGLLSISVGLILNTLARNFKELTCQTLNLDKQVTTLLNDRSLKLSQPHMIRESALLKSAVDDHATPLAELWSAVLRLLPKHDNASDKENL
jgi:hypothetical protein